jgi:hypothetical protein
MSSDKLFAWGWRLLPLLIIVGLLIPGDAWVAQEIRTFAGLITVLILPGYALARLLRLFEHFDNWLDVLSLSVALSWGSGLILWLLFFFLGIPLEIVSFVWLGMTLIGLIISAFVPLPRHLTARPSQPWIVIGIVLWILAVTGVVYLYGGRVDGDAYSYMTWLRNVRVGDIRPGVNIHASWEENYPFFKNLYAPTYIYYAMTSFLSRVDTNWVWTRAPAVWTSVMLTVQFSLTRQMFKRKAPGYALVFLLPLVYAGRPIFTSLGDSHHICNFVLLPMAFWLFLQAVFAESKIFWWIFPLAVLVAISLTFEHLPHIIHFLLVIGTFALFQLLSSQRVFWKSTLFILVVLLLIAPFIWHTLQLASVYGFDARQATAGNLNMSEVGRAERFLKLGDEQFFIVIPRKLLAAGTSPGLTILGIIFTALHLKRLWQHETAWLLIASMVIVFFIGLNPLLTPLLSRLIAPHVTHRLSEALIIFPVLAYGVMRTVLQLRASWLYRHRLKYSSSILLTVLVVLVCYNLSQEAVDAVKMKARGVIYSPAGVSSNLSDRLIRQVIEKELNSPPYPILNPPAQLTRYLDAATLNYIREEIPSDSVFLSERLTEYNLPAYVDQLAYLGRLGWPEWGDICPRVRGEGAETAFPRVRRPEVYHRLNVACAILDPRADPQDIEKLLMENSKEIDYILVTPNISYLLVNLDQVMPRTQVYDKEYFTIYSVKALR